MGETKDKKVDFALHDQTGALLMLNKNERKLLKEILIMSLHSQNVRELIVKKLGKKDIDIAQNLLDAMGGS